MTKSKPSASNTTTIINCTTPHPGQQLEVLTSPATLQSDRLRPSLGQNRTGKKPHPAQRPMRKKKRCWWLAPTRQMSSQVWRDLKNSIKRLKGIKISETERRIDLPGGGMIAVRSAFHPDNLRGEGLDLVVFDEAAFMPPQIWTEIVRPMLVSAPSAAPFSSARPTGVTGSATSSTWAKIRSCHNGNPSNSPPPLIPSFASKNWMTSAVRRPTTSGIPNTWRNS